MKLEAKDLRIGNLIWLKIHHHPVIVEQIYIPFHEYNFWLTTDLHEGEKIEDYEPIPLTEEWLLKFGFEKKGKRISKEWFYLWHDEGKIVFAIAEMIENIGKYLIINYVHELQNLFHSLTGEELTLNQNP
jgi:hypothetical protein